MNVSQARTPANLRRPKRVAVTLRQVLESSRRPTRLELVCWVLNVDERLAQRTWEFALHNGLLEAAGADGATGAAMFKLSERGQFALRHLRRRRSATRRSP